MSVHLILLMGPEVQFCPMKGTGTLILTFDLSSWRNKFQILSGKLIQTAYRISAHQRDLFLSFSELQNLDESSGV